MDPSACVRLSDWMYWMIEIGLDDGDRYGYIKNHKKTVKNGQARTRESKEYKAEARKVKGQMGQIKASLNLSQVPSHVAMVKAQIYVGFALNSLTKEAQAVTSRNDSLAILKCTQMM
ncbi:hypothetical protein Tco_0539628 [Tanacetum coccineum]